MDTNRHWLGSRVHTAKAPESMRSSSTLSRNQSWSWSRIRSHMWTSACLLGDPPTIVLVPATEEPGKLTRTSGLRTPSTCTSYKSRWIVGHLLEDVHPECHSAHLALGHPFHALVAEFAMWDGSLLGYPHGPGWRALCTAVSGKGGGGAWLFPFVVFFFLGSSVGRSRWTGAMRTLI